MKPKNCLHKEIIYTYGCDPIQAMGDKDRKIARENFDKKIKSTGFIYLPGSKLHEAKDNLTMGSCLQDAVINSALGLENT